MAKILTDFEMAEIISDTVENAYMLDDAGTYTSFLEDLGELITKYFGGMRGIPGQGPGPGWTLGFYVNENVPEDGGIYAPYDRSVTWKDGKEVSK